MYNEGISNVGSLIDMALEKGVLEKRGSWLSFKGNQLAQGRDAAKDALRNDENLYREIEEATLAAMSATEPA
jgi:recombination protein RecA